MYPETAPPEPAPETLHGCLHHWARRHPGADAGIEPGRRYSYADLSEAVDACASAMIAAGVSPGDRVATLAPPGLDFLVTFLATASIGGIWIGLNPRYADPELDALVARVEPSLVFSAGEVDGRSYRDWGRRLPAGVRAVWFDAPGESGGTSAFSAFVAAGKATPPVELARRFAGTRASDPCLIVFTSGSTGTPKGAMISHAALVGASRVQLGQWRVQPLRVLNNLPINHIGCVGDLGCYALVGGGALVFTPGFDPAASLRAIRDERVTVWGQVPTMFQLTLDAPQFRPGDLASLQLVFWGGAHAPPELVERLRPLAPRLATSYGQTETVGSITFTGPGTEDTGGNSVGRAVPPYRLRIVDDAGRSLPPGEAGEVQVQTPFGMSGYWRDPVATAAAVTSDGWRRTGDVGVLSPQGGLRLTGRVHDVFKSGGYNLYPLEIESALEAHPAVREASVVGVPDPLFGHAAVAFIVAAAPRPDPDDLRAFLRGRLANYKVPKRITFIDRLPRLAVGKIDKQALRDRALAP